MKTIFYLLFLFFSTFCFGQNYLEWVRPHGSTAMEDVRSIELDASGNVYATGSFSGTVDFEPSAGVFNLTSNGLEDIFVRKLDSNGNLIWAVSMGGASTDNGIDLTLDNAGNVLVTGVFQNATVDFDPGPGTNNLAGVGWEIFTLKLSNSGTHIWARRMGGTSTDFGTGIITDNSGNVYTSGFFFASGGDFDPGPGTASLNSNGLHDSYVQKMDANGNFMWVRSWGGLGEDGVSDIQVTSSNDLVLTGHFTSTIDADPTAGTFTVSTNGLDDAFIQRLDFNGNFIGFMSFGGTGVETIRDVVRDAAGNIFIVGAFSNTVDFDPGVGVQNRTSSNAQDAFLLKLTSGFVFSFVYTIGGTGLDKFEGVSFDSFGDVYTTGIFSGTVDFDPSPSSFALTSAGATDIVVLRLSASGSLIWALRQGATSSDVANAIASQTTNTVYVAGNFSLTVDFEPSSNFQNVMSVGGQDGYVEKLTINTALPVLIHHFDAQIVDDSRVFLNWELESTVNLNHFELLKSKEGTDWENVMIVPIKYQSGPQFYSEIDDSPFDGISYYEIRAFNKDNQQIYSDVDVVQKDLKINCLVFPSYATSYFTVLFDSEVDAVVNVYDLNGKLIAAENVKSGEQVSIDKLSVGNYRVRVLVANQLFEQVLTKIE